MIAPTEIKVRVGDVITIDAHGLQGLLDVLRNRGYRVLGPTVRDGAIIYDDLRRVEELPVGWTDEQEGGTYRLKRRDDDAYFGYAVGPTSWKRFLHPPVIRLWSAKRDGRADGNMQMEPERHEPGPMAFIGVRSCELAAIEIQDQVFLENGYVDPIYKKRRDKTFIVAVNCGQAGNTCFCVSMGTGPRAKAGYDLALTEVLENGSHYFVVEVGTDAGAQAMVDVPCHEAVVEEKSAARAATERAIGQMGRSIDTTGIKELLYANYDNARWDQVAERCLACANCTMACPTCFCTTVEDVTDLTGAQAERVRKWDSCFTGDFSYIHGGNIRQSGKSRYRQWMTHKLATWQDQFGSLGCVGCGRCITWCPVGIDITEEARAIRETDAREVKTDA